MNILYSLLAAEGRRGDSELAHVTPEEKALLKSRGGAGTINPKTGLKEFHGSFANPWNTPMGHPAHHYTWEDNPVTDAVSDVGDKLEDMGDADWWTGDNSLVGDSDFWVGENSLYQEHLVREGGIFETDEMKKRRLERELREKTPDDVPFYMGMDDYVEDVRTGEFTTDDFMALTDEEKFYMAQGMFKGETDFASYHLKDYHKYMPTYDQEGYDLIQERGLKEYKENIEEVSKIGEMGQASLLNLYHGQQKRQAQRGYAVTGNPMVDRQRENIFSGIQKDVEGGYDKTMLAYEDWAIDKQTHREDFHTEWEDALYDWMDAVNVGDEG